MIKQLEQILIDKKASLKDAMKQLDKTAEKILFVVEDNNKLLGSLTDGDIRRWILNGGGLSDSAGDVCFQGTYFVEENYSVAKVKNEMIKRRIVYVPVINKSREIIEFLVWNKVFDGKITRKVSNKLDVEVVIMAGGKGTRLDPFTKILPKPLIPIGNKTILEIIIERLTEFNVNKFYVSVNYKANIIKSYFDELRPDYEINYIYEENPLGTVGALSKLTGKINKTVLLTNCDIIIETDYFDLYNHHIKNENDVTVVASIKNYNIPYGICEIENGGILLNIKEKPEYEFLVNTGMYVLNPDVIKYIPKNEFFHMTHLIEKVKELGLKVGVYPISEDSWIDIGEWNEYKKSLEKLKI